MIPILWCSQLACMPTHIPLSSSTWHPFLDSAHPAWCPCCSNAMQRVTTWASQKKTKSISKLAMMRLKRCGFSSCHKSDMISPLVSNFEFRKMWDQRAKRSFWRYPSFSNGFLRVFYGLGKHEVFWKHDVFKIHYGFSTGFLRVPWATIGSNIFAKRTHNITISMWHR